jgi:hypothetical protein
MHRLLTRPNNSYTNKKPCMMPSFFTPIDFLPPRTSRNTTQTYWARTAFMSLTMHYPFSFYAM